MATPKKNKVADLVEKIQKALTEGQFDMTAAKAAALSHQIFEASGATLEDTSKLRPFVQDEKKYGKAVDEAVEKLYDASNTEMGKFMNIADNDEKEFFSSRYFGELPDHVAGTVKANPMAFQEAAGKAVKNLDKLGEFGHFYMTRQAQKDAKGVDEKELKAYLTDEIKLKGPIDDDKLKKNKGAIVMSIAMGQTSKERLAMLCYKIE
ncbi:hypothetical protein KY330_04365 [Candidatus Woesearchaeota archaeon]|nr:hypothetical protein [Candidatus Woesearchaeota archaeon]